VEAYLINHRYYRIEPDGFWVEAHNPAWSDNPELADAWSWRFHYFTGDKALREQMIEFLKLQMGWEERLTQGTVLLLYRGHADRAGSLPDGGLCDPFIHVVSSRAKQLFDRLGLSRLLEFEQYPVYTPDGKSFLQNYYCVRYLVHLDCADEQLSYFRRLPDPPYVECKLMLRKQLIGDHRVFLVKNYNFDVEVMRGDVKRAIERASLTGFHFRELETV